MRSAWPDEVCLIEADRDHERSRLTYRQFGEAAASVAAALEESGFAAGDRAAIIMTNQSKWLISAYAIFFAVAFLFRSITNSPPPNICSCSRTRKLGSCLSNTLCGARSCQAPAFREHKLRDCGRYRSARKCRSCGRQALGGIPRRARAGISPAQANGHGLHRLFLRHGRAPQGMRADARQLSRTVPRGHARVSFLARRAISEHHPHESCDRFHGRLSDAVHRRRHRRSSAHLRPEFIREAFTRYKITYMAVVPLILKNLQRGLRGEICGSAAGQT